MRIAKAGLANAKKAMLSRKYNIVILDEINTAQFFHLITVAEMLELIQNKPDGVELIFTGRYAPQELLDVADLVTEMVERKHYFNKNVPSRNGIEQ